MKKFLTAFMTVLLINITVYASPEPVIRIKVASDEAIGVKPTEAVSEKVTETVNTTNAAPVTETPETYTYPGNAIYGMADSFLKRYASSSPAMNGLAGNVKILTYHLISEDTNLHSAYCISPEMFENDLKYLKDNGYTFMTTSQLPVSDTTQGKIAVITFDDGYSSDYKYVVPLLEKYEAKATFFIVGSYIDTPGYLTTEELKEMSTKSCVELGNHSYEIHDYSYQQLTAMYRDPAYEQQILDDYAKNDEFFVNLFGWAPISLSYPYGIYSLQIDEGLKAKGKIITVSTAEIPYNYKSTAPAGRKNRDSFRAIDLIVQ